MKGKRLVALLLALGTCFAVAACDNTETSSDTGTNTESSASSDTGTNGSDSLDTSDSSDSSVAEPETVTTITEGEWLDALAWKGQTNWQITLLATQGEMSMTQLRKCDGTTVCVKMISGEYSREEYYTKEGEKYYYISNGNKGEITQKRYEEQLTASLESMFAYSDFTYAEADKAYTAAEVQQGDTIIAKDVALKFEDGLLVSLSMLQQGDRAGVFDMAYVMTLEYGVVETIELPTLGE